MSVLFLAHGAHDLQAIKKEMQHIQGLVIKGQIFRITEYSILERIHKDHQVQLLSEWPI